MAERFDECIYSDYFAEYSLRRCTCPTKMSSECNCENCQLFIPRHPDLKDCPFCGGKAAFGISSGSLSFRMECCCIECGASVKAEDAKKVIELWNRRAYGHS